MIHRQLQVTMAKRGAFETLAKAEATVAAAQQAAADDRVALVRYLLTETPDTLQVVLVLETLPTVSDEDGFAAIDLFLFHRFQQAKGAQVLGIQMM